MFDVPDTPDVADAIAAVDAAATSGDWRPRHDAEFAVDENSECESAVAIPKIAIIDDQPINVKIVRKYLQLAGYQDFVTVTDAREALDVIHREHPDVVLLDIMMPFISGLDILAELRRNEEYADLPVIILTAASEQATKLEALKLGATDFLTKPVDAVELETRLRNVLTLRAHQDRIKLQAKILEAEAAMRGDEVMAAQSDAVECLTAIAACCDAPSAGHVARVGQFAEIIARHLGMDREFCDQIRVAAPLHDLGKVGVPDAILQTPGRLEDAEFAQIARGESPTTSFELNDESETHATFRSHTILGRELASRGNSSLLDMAAVIAHTHHERWDGSGYPRRLRGEEIPIEGQITALADVFDVLTHARPCQPAIPPDKSLTIIAQQRGIEFNPAIVDALFAGIERIMAAYHQEAS